MWAAVASDGQVNVENLPIPDPGPGQVRIAVAAAGVNRADVMQAAGIYPPPPGEPDTLGLEVSGTVDAIGPGVDESWVGREVAALLAGGGYAEYALAPVAGLFPVPGGAFRSGDARVDLVFAGALPEVAATVWSNLGDIAVLSSGETVLIHGGGSGIGTHAIQFARARGARVAVTVGGDIKAAAAAALGAECVINYRDTDFAVAAAEWSPAGVDVILDIIGARYLEQNLNTLAVDGRMVTIGLQGGARAEVNLGQLLGKRIRWAGSALRTRPAEAKARIVAGTIAETWPLLESGAVKPVISQTLPADRWLDAHELLDSPETVGKVLLRFD